MAAKAIASSTILAMAAILWISAPAVGQGPIQVCGLVLGKNLHGDLRPISFANVTAISGKAKVTQSTFDGSYCMFLPPGTYALVASSPGYISKTIQITALGGSLNGIDFILDPSGEPIPEFPGVPLPLMAAVALLVVLARLRRRRTGTRRS